MSLYLRDVWTGVRLCDVIMSWTRIEMTVWYTLIFSNFSSNPVCDVLLVHRVFVCIILARSRRFHVATLNGWLNPECKFGQLTGSFIWFGWITEIKITKDCVVVRRGCLLICCVCLSSFISAKLCSLVRFLCNSWVVRLGTNSHNTSPLVDLEFLFIIKWGFIKDFV